MKGKLSNKKYHCINKINNQMQYLREKLNNQVDKDKCNLTDETLIISQELDEVIVKYIKLKMINQERSCRNDKRYRKTYKKANGTYEKS